MMKSLATRACLAIVCLAASTPAASIAVDDPIACGDSSNGLEIGPIAVVGALVDPPVYDLDEWREQAEANLASALLASSYNPGCADCDGEGCDDSATWRGAIGGPMSYPGGGYTGGLILDWGAPFTVECSDCVDPHVGGPN